jgi:hypothetical protein
MMPIKPDLKPAGAGGMRGKSKVFRICVLL